MKKQPLVYIVVVNWKRYDDTIDCLKSLGEIDYKNYKIVVVDNESQEREATNLKKKFPNIKIIKNRKNLGFSQPNNQGIKVALKDKADYVLLLNNDTVVKGDFLKNLIGYAEKKNFRGILNPKILYYDSDIVWAIGGRLSVLTSIPRMIGQGKPSSNFTEIIEPDYASGCALLVHREVIDKVGLLDTRYFAYYEDTDWSYRIRAAGFKVKVIPKSIIWHKVSQSTNQKTGKIGETYAYLLAKNGILFGVLNLDGLSKLMYLINQYTTKPFLYLIFKVDSKKAAISYLKGLVDGSRYLLRNYA